MIYTFGEFELDTDLYELRREGAPVPVEPQVFEVVRYLLEHRDRVVTKQDLLDNVWRTRFVTESTLTTRIKAARRALDDDGRVQRVISTVHGRGYRFIVPVREQHAPSAVHVTEGEPAIGASASAPEPFVGRKDELAALQRWLEDALGDRRQTVVVTGEPGLGKSTLIDAFVASARGAHDLTVATARCLEHQGAAEPYMPLLDALSRLCQADRRGEVRRILAKRAATWLVEMPWLVEEDELDLMRRSTIGGTRARMLREFVEAVEAIARLRPLVLVIDDLQWSDHSTLDALNALARSSEPANLLLLCSCRTTELVDPDHPAGALFHDLRLRASCHELALRLLTEDEVEQYLRARLTDAQIAERWKHPIYARTEGNPLYVRALLDDWMATDAPGTKGGAIAETTDPSHRVPESLRQMIERRLRALSSEQQKILETAAVIGKEVSASLVATVLDLQEEHVEEVGAHLARTQRFVRLSAGRGRDETVPAVLEFVHALYREVLYERIPGVRRARLHTAIARGLEAYYGTRTGEHAAELAWHHERGRDPRRAAAYLQRAAAQSLRRHAYSEAVAQLNGGLRLVEALGDASDLEIDMQDMLAIALVTLHGWAHPDVEPRLTRALELSRSVDGPLRTSVLLYHLAAFHESRGQYERSQDLLEQRLEVDARTTDATPLLESHELLACSLFHQGKFESSLAHADRGWSLYDPARHLDLIASTAGENLGVSCISWAVLDTWFLGRPDRAVDRMSQALELAQDPDHSYSLAAVHEQAATLYQLRHEPEAVLRHATATIDLGKAQGHEFRIVTGSMLRGWARVALGELEDGLAELRWGLDGYIASGARIALAYYMGVLAEAQLRAGRPSECLESVSAALGEITTRGFCYEAELHRLAGFVLIKQGNERDGTERLRRSLEIARGQKALSLELRTATTMARVAHASHGRSEARTVLASVRARMEGGSKTPDVREASRLVNGS